MAKRVTLFVDEHGKQMPMDNDVANAAANEIVDKGDLIAVLMRQGDLLSFHIIDDSVSPRGILECLEQATAAYREVLKGQ